MKKVVFAAILAVTIAVSAVAGVVGTDTAAERGVFPMSIVTQW